MGEQQQRDEEILVKIVSARNKILAGNRDLAQKILNEVKEELNCYRGTDQVYFALLRARDYGFDCADSEESPGEMKKSEKFGVFQESLDSAIRLVKPEGLTELADRGDDLSATRPY